MKNIFYRQSFVGANILLLALAGNVLHANPTGGTVTQGSATFSSSGSQFNINQSSANAFINWQSFNINAGETVNFNQPSASSLTWNQINDANPSQILGSLNANGYVVLQNSAGFYIGGQASITAHGLIMTTASASTPNFSSGGPWSFNTPPPTAKIVNYGQINIAGGGSAFLIANDIENGGAISAPGGKIGLYAGQKVLISTSPDGRGLSAQATIPEGLVDNNGKPIKVDNNGKLVADAGSITLRAQMVNQNGLVQANSAKEVNGTIELVGSDSVNLGANSVVSAQGDSQGISSGGSITIQGGNSFSDQAGSTISIAGGAQGGDGGQVEISAPQMGTINSIINGGAMGEFSGGILTVDPANIWLASADTDPQAPSDYSVVNVNSFSGFSKISLEADNNIALNTLWSLSDPGVAATLSLTAGNNIIMNDNSGISAEKNWTVNLTAASALNLGVSSVISADNLNLTVPSLSSAAGNVSFQALDNINLNTSWILGDPGVAATLSLTAGNNITFDDSAYIVGGKNWSINLTAGAGFVPGQPTPASGSDGVYLKGGAYLETSDGDINLWAANEVQVGAGAIRTFGGGNIYVATEFGDVNAGSGTLGFQFQQSTAPYYTVDKYNVGGISTSSGGNVAITAGGNVISYMPTSADGSDAGTGAFGSQPGNVTITAGGSVYGHYVVANGTGTIIAGQDAGTAAGNTFALSLINGGWSVNAPNGNIYLQEVRNPNGVFNGAGKGMHLFDYGADASVDLTAGNGVYLTGQNLPRASDSPALPMIYPPILNIIAGSGGVTLGGNVTLYPSPDQNLSITTTDGGNFDGIPNAFGDVPELLMSDSAQNQWTPNGTFEHADHGSLQNEPNEFTPVLINISGSMEDLNLIVTKVADIAVGGDMINCGFSGQNLQASDHTSIAVAGQIYNTSAYSFVTLDQAIPDIPVEDLFPGMSSSWENIFALAVDPAIAGMTVPPGTTPDQLATVAWGQYHLAAFGAALNTATGLPQGGNPGFVYDPATGQLGFSGHTSSTSSRMSSAVLSALTHPLTILHLVNGQAVIDNNPNDNSPGRTYGQIETDTINWGVAPASIQALFAASQGAPSAINPQLGLRIGGPGAFDIHAARISLGNTYGILSCGVYDPVGKFQRYANLASVTPSGATLNVTVTGPDAPADPGQPVSADNPMVSSLNMLTSTIAALGGGDVNITSTGGSMNLGSPVLFDLQRSLGVGVFTTGGGSVNVNALDDININGSRIATLNGGNIFVKSDQGTVNVGSGASTVNKVTVSFVNPATGKAAHYDEYVYGSGIVAETLVPPLPGQPIPPNAAPRPGDITVETPQGDIVADAAGILQVALDGSFAPGPSITLTAGTPFDNDWNSTEPPLFVGNIDLGNSGVIGGSVTLKATGNINAKALISRQNANVNAKTIGTLTLLSAGQANVSGASSGQGISIVGVQGVNANGIGAAATLLGQNVSVNGGAAQSTLGSSVTATASTQSAAQQASQTAAQQVASDIGGNDDEKKKKKKEKLVRSVGRVTVILPKSS